LGVKFPGDEIVVRCPKCGPVTVRLPHRPFGINIAEGNSIVLCPKCGSNLSFALQIPIRTPLQKLGVFAMLLLTLVTAIFVIYKLLQ
jgi:hypothetical protein